MPVPWCGPSAVAREEGNGHQVTSSRSHSEPPGSERTARAEWGGAFGCIGCHDAMLTEYIDEALRRARYELIEDEETPYCEGACWCCGACRSEYHPLRPSSHLRSAAVRPAERHMERTLHYGSLKELR